MEGQKKSIKPHKNFGPWHFYFDSMPIELVLRGYMCAVGEQQGIIKFISQGFINKEETQPE